jgi:hypothetical protein
MRFRSRFVVLFLLALLLSNAALAGITGSISGLVTGPSGAVVSGAQAVAVEAQTEVRTETVTDSKGFHDFPTLAIGIYCVVVDSAGFKTLRQTGIVIEANSVVKVEVTWLPGTATENAQVRSDAQMGEVMNS